MAILSTTQSAVGDNGTGGTTVSATWGAATKVPALLIAVVSINLAGGGAPTITAPSGWISASSIGSTNTFTNVFYIKPYQSTSRSGAETFTLSISLKAVCIIAEVGGSPVWFDNTGLRGGGGNFSNTGTSTTADNGGGSGTATIVPVSFAVAGVATREPVTYSAPSAGWTLVNQQSSSGGGGAGTKISGALLYGEFSPEGSSDALTLTISLSKEWSCAGLSENITVDSMALMGTGY